MLRKTIGVLLALCAGRSAVVAAQEQAEPSEVAEPEASAEPEANAEPESSPSTEEPEPYRILGYVETDYSFNLNQPRTGSRTSAASTTVTTPSPSRTSRSA